MSLTTKLVDSLTIDKDLSVGREPLQTGRFRYFGSVLRRNSSGIMLMNLLIVLFAVPAAFLLFYLLPSLQRAATSSFNFSGELGIGFPGASNDFIPASVAVYNIRMIIFACLIPCFSLIGLGMAGGFYCSRNYLWGTRVKLRVHFWRGIKKYWWNYLTSFTAIGVVVASIAISIINHLKMSLTAPAPWWSYIVMIMTCLVGLLMLIYMLTFLPIQTMYNFKFKDKIKNSLVLSLMVIVPALILCVLLALPMLLMLNNISRIILYMFLLMIGFGFYVLAISSFGQYACDNFINYIYDERQKVDEKERLRQQKIANRNKANNANKPTSYKAKGGARTGNVEDAKTVKVVDASATTPKANNNKNNNVNKNINENTATAAPRAPKAPNPKSNYSTRNNTKKK